LLRLVSKEGHDDIDVSLEKLESRIVSESKQLVPDQHTDHAGIDLDLALECVSPTVLTFLLKLSKK